MRHAKNSLIFLPILLILALPPSAYADDQKDTYISYTYVDAVAGALSSQSTMTDPTTGAQTSSTTSFGMTGATGSYGFDKLFDFGKYLDVQGAVLGGYSSSSGGGSTTLGILQGGVGLHADFKPALGDISVFVTAETESTSVSASGYSSTSSNSLIIYGLKWMILNNYEWDFYGTSQGGNSSSSGSSSPAGGNGLNLQFTWIQHPNAQSMFVGGQYQHQSQNGTTNDTILGIFGYRW